MYQTKQKEKKSAQNEFLFVNTVTIRRNESFRNKNAMVLAATSRQQRSNLNI